MKEEEGRIDKFYLATPFPTEYNTKFVSCHTCNVGLYTHPLAANYFCQTCCSISSVVRGGEGGDAVEEKMADKEDEDYEYGYLQQQR